MPIQVDPNQYLATLEETTPATITPSTPGPAPPDMRILFYALVLAVVLIIALVILYLAYKSGT